MIRARAVDDYRQASSRKCTGLDIHIGVDINSRVCALRVSPCVYPPRASPRPFPRVNEPPAELPSVTGIEINKQALGAISRSVNICSTVSRLQRGGGRGERETARGRERKELPSRLHLSSSFQPHLPMCTGTFVSGYTPVSIGPRARR